MRLGSLSTGRHKSYNSQVDYHRDCLNARVLSSTFYFGRDYLGGEMVFPHLGVAVHGGPGYSVHGTYDTLVHGISKIRVDPQANGKPPQRVALAVYASSKVFAGAARFSASLGEGEAKFSDENLWLPFYPRGFEVEKACDILKKEGKRLDKAYEADARLRRSQKASSLNETV